MDTIQKYIKQLEAQAITAYQNKDLEELRNISRLMNVAIAILTRLEAKETSK